MGKGFTITELPIYDENYLGEKDIISRKIISKGELATISISEMNYMAVVNFLVGKEPRGNHYHNKKVEYIYICKGKVKAYFKNRFKENGKIEVVEVKEGSLIFIKPGVSHAIEALEEGFGIEFSPTKFDIVKEDNYKDILI